MKRKRSFRQFFAVGVLAVALSVGASLWAWVHADTQGVPFKELERQVTELRVELAELSHGVETLRQNMVGVVAGLTGVAAAANLLNEQVTQLREIVLQDDLGLTVVSCPQQDAQDLERAKAEERAAEAAWRSAVSLQNAAWNAFLEEAEAAEAALRFPPNFALSAFHLLEAIRLKAQWVDARHAQETAWNTLQVKRIRCAQR